VSHPVVFDFALGGLLVVIFGHIKFGLDGSEAGFHVSVVAAVATLRGEQTSPRSANSEASCWRFNEHIKQLSDNS
jgi:hypothetical protein